MSDLLSPIAATVAAFIASRPPAEDPRFEAIALDLFAFHYACNAPYRSLCQQDGQSPATIRRWQDIPAAPAAAFKDLELTVLPPAARSAVFHSSGTTAQRPSRHFHNKTSLALYEQSLLAWAEPHLRLQADPVRRLVLLTPPPDNAPHSSLAHMLNTLRQDNPTCAAAFHGRVGPAGDWELETGPVLAALQAAADNSESIAIFGTAFQFVHCLDALAAEGRRLPLPPGSRIMETGGYKGRSRSIPKPELHQALATAFALRPEDIVTEYGMSELASQAYDAVAGLAAPRHLRFPPWARAQIVSPETGGEVPEGTPGLLRLLDLANVASVCALQTADLAERHGDGFVLLGRAPAAEPRGCSLLST